MKTMGLSIFDPSDSLDRVKLPYSELKLLGTDGGVEIMLQELAAESTFDVYSSKDKKALMEFFYVLEGELEYQNGKEKVTLKPGNYFYTKNLEATCTFDVIKDTKLLFVSPQPIFHYIGEVISELHNINAEIDEKDKYTLHHCERVQNLAVKIAMEMNIDRSKISGLAVAALFHDLGKISIDHDILIKPEKLSNEEFAEVKKHPIHSAKYVKKIKYLDASGIVIQHHEKFDGTGYPKGLKGEEILEEARIIAVADAYDAMTNDRPFRKAVTPQEAVNEIIRLSGTWYDPLVVNAFVQVLKKERII
ncbi:MAG TPA: HD domain-containing phosphohydrolase [Haloplasmataceae bacterium]